MKPNISGILQVTGKSAWKLARFTGVAIGAGVITHGPDIIQILAQTDPKWAAVAAIAYTALDAWKHRDKIQGDVVK